MKNNRFSVLLIATLICGVLSCVAVGQGLRPRPKTFTKDEVSEITSLLKKLDPKDYRIVLPKFENSRIVGSETYGRLPVTQVRRLASTGNVAYSETGNLQAIFEYNGRGCLCAAVARRIERIVQNIGRNEFSLLY